MMRCKMRRNQHFSGNRVVSNSSCAFGVDRRSRSAAENPARQEREQNGILVPAHGGEMSTAHAGGARDRNSLCTCRHRAERRGNFAPPARRAVRADVRRRRWRRAQGTRDESDGVMGNSCGECHTRTRRADGRAPAQRMSRPGNGARDLVAVRAVLSALPPLSIARRRREARNAECKVESGCQRTSVSCCGCAQARASSGEDRSSSRRLRRPQQ